MININMLRHSLKRFSKVSEVPSLKQFMQQSQPDIQLEPELGTHLKDYIVNQAQGKSYFIETHGCQMNASDSEIVAAIMEQAGYSGAATM